MGRSEVTIHTVAELYRLYTSNRIILAPEFQRNSIWPTAARAYLIDTILQQQPIPQLLLQRLTTAQGGQKIYAVVDGQQRLRAIFDFIDDKFGLTQTSAPDLRNKRFTQLPNESKARIMSHELLIQELSGYTDTEIREMFVRINKYVVSLSKQELRHAKAHGEFHRFVERVGKWPFWRDHKVFSVRQLLRMRAVEFSAELAILLIEGPQDKKKAVDLYYVEYQSNFPEKSPVESRLHAYLRWVTRALPDLSRRRFRHPVDFYALVGAIDQESRQGVRLKRLDPKTAGTSLARLEAATRSTTMTKLAAEYVAAAS